LGVERARIDLDVIDLYFEGDSRTCLQRR